MLYSRFYILFLLSLFLLGCGDKPAPELVLQTKAEQVLSDILVHQDKWVKVHAAEFLIELDLARSVDSIFKKENTLFAKESPYRIGIWRVLSQTDDSPQKWINRIIEVAKDTTAPDQLHAIETLAKRQIPPRWIPQALKNTILNSDNIRLRTYLQWAIAVPPDSLTPPNVVPLQKLLFSKEVEAQRIAALAIRKLNHYPATSWTELADLAIHCSEDSKAKNYLVAAALVLAPDQKQEQFQRLMKTLLTYKNSQSKSERYILCETLAETGSKKHLRTLMDIMAINLPIFNLKTLESPQEHPDNIDVSGAAAYAILRILNRETFIKN